MRPEIDILFIGAFAPDTPGHQNSATSRAAVLFQTGFLKAIAQSGLPNPTVRTYFPVPSFPKSRTLIHIPQEATVEGIAVRSLAHVNLGPLKVLTLGFSAAFAALKWGLSRKDKRRIVVTYNLNAPPAFLLVPVCRLLKMEFVPFIGDIYVPGDFVPDSLSRRFEFALQKWAIPRTDGLIVCNRSIIDDFAPARRHMLVEGGVPRSFVERFRYQDQVGSKGFNAVFAGQLSELNGVGLLLGAVRACDVPGLRVTVMGSGALEDDVRSAAEEDPRIVYLGPVPYEEVLEHYRRADLLLNLRDTSFTTHRYVFPSKVVECLATGVPLLTTNTGHVESEFGDFVFILEQETPSCLASTLSFIASLPRESRLEIALRAQEYVLENKTWEAHARSLKDYLEDGAETAQEAA
ncbi:MAG TPA: glycosyltransferase [Fimbriimonadaceae bacterium]|nr:glycosyltransferase [Fimbriimonadaceae bacterium]